MHLGPAWQEAFVASRYGSNSRRVARLIVPSEGETTNLDLEWEPRILPPVQIAIGPVFPDEELVAGKMLRCLRQRLVSEGLSMHWSQVRILTAEQAPDLVIPEILGSSYIERLSGDLSRFRDLQHWLKPTARVSLRVVR